MTPTEQAATMRQSAALLLQLADERDPPVPALFRKPFSARSLWNSRPQGVTLSDIGLSESTERPYPYNPMVAGSVTRFLARPGDVSMVVQTPNGPVLIPHWPAATVPDGGLDGHCDIFDLTPEVKLVHSFWLLKGSGANWSCRHYGHTAIDGLGWTDGARAAGVPASAGIITLQEIADGGPIPHALCVALMYEDLAPTPGPLAWVPPASRSDFDNGRLNTGRIPEGALLMLPPDFDTTGMTPFLKRVAEAFKTRGGWVTDRTQGTPYIVVTESPFDANDSPAATADLQRMRLGLRMVSKVGSWLDADGQPFVPTDTSLTPPSAIPPASAVRVAGEGQAFAVVGGWYWYGANGNFASRWLPAGSYKADNATFGDPAVGAYKAAYRAA